MDIPIMAATLWLTYCMNFFMENLDFCKFNSRVV